MKIIESYFYILREIKLITHNKIEAEAEAELIFGSYKFKKYFGKSLLKKEIFGNHSNTILKKEVISFLDKILNKRSKGIPIQYLLDEAWFYGHEFHVYKDNNIKALIPRNETEFIIESFLEEVKNNKLNKINAIDIGTGTCCIPISIILNVNKKIYFDAIEPYSYEIAEKNILKYKLSDQIRLHKKGLNNIFDIFNQKYDFVTANLPYIPEEHKISELKFEPDKALYAIDEGLYYIKKLVELLPEIINKNGLAFIEIDPSQSYFFKSLKYFKAEIKKDLNSLKRLVVLKFR